MRLRPRGFILLSFLPFFMAISTPALADGDPEIADAGGR
jgi:hypothetical protein